MKEESSTDGNREMTENEEEPAKEESSTDGNREMTENEEEPAEEESSTDGNREMTENEEEPAKEETNGDGNGEMIGNEEEPEQPDKQTPKEQKQTDKFSSTLSDLQISKDFKLISPIKSPVKKRKQAKKKKAN